MEYTFDDYLSVGSVAQLNNYSDVVGLEAGFISDVKSKLYEISTGISKKIQTRTEGIRNITYSVGTLAIIKDIEKFEKKSSKIIVKDFRDIEVIQVPTIIGLQKPIITVIDTIMPYFYDLQKNSIKNLEKIDDVISDFIGDSESRKSFKDRTSFTERLNDEYNVKMQKELSGMFDVKDKTEFVNFGFLFRSNNETKEVLKKIVQINKEFNDKDLIKLNKSIYKISQRVNTLIKMLEVQDIIASKEAVQNIVSALNVLSNYMSSISNVYYLQTKIMEVAMVAKKIHEDK